MIQAGRIDLFAGIPVTDYKKSLEWYEQLFGHRPAFFPLDTEAVWEVADNRYVYIVQQPEHAGHAMHLLFVDDLDTLMAQTEARGLKPSKEETLLNGVRKAVYRDPDGNEIGSGGLPR